MNYFFHKTIFNKSTGLKYLLFVGLLCLSQITSAQIYNTQDISGSLNNNFDADRVQSEIDLQREVTQEFSRNVQDLNRRQNEKLTELKAQYDNGEISLKDYNDQAKEVERNKTIINMVTSGLLAPTDSVLGIATSTVAPLASQRIGIYFKELADKNPDGKLTTNQELAHIAAHMLLGATTAQTNDGNALAGALSAGGAEGVATYLSQTLFDKENPADLDEDERESISAVSRILGATISTAVGDNSLNAYVGANVASNAVDENAIKTIVSVGKILRQATKQRLKHGKLSAKDFGKILKEEGLDIADNVITLLDGELNWNDAQAIIDLVIGTEFNKANKGATLKKLEELAGKAKKNEAKERALEAAQKRKEELSRKERPGQPFTRAGKKAVIDENKIKNDSVTRCEHCKQETVPAQQSKKGVTPPQNETQVDHKIARAKNGSGTPNNGQVLCRGCNRAKGAK